MNKIIKILLAYAHLVSAPFSSTPVPTRRFQTEERVVALTFDDGPHPVVTEKILSLLESYDARATFFVIGQNAVYYPDVLRMISDKGHEIANHTYYHGALFRESKDEVKEEIEKAEDIILSVCQKKTTLFRPPEGCVSENVLSAAGELGYDVILWGIDTNDWAHTSKEEIVNNIKKNVKPGSIILFHDYISGEAHTVEALGEILPYLSKLGYSFKTISEIKNQKQP